jgi:PKD repeat protein
LITELERPLPTTGLREAYESLTVAELGRVLYQLNYEKRIGSADTLALVNDVLAAERACTPLQRRGPMGQFVADVRAHVQGPYRQFLLDAAVPLFGEHAYPNNQPPTAAFTPASRTGTATPGHPLHAIFRDTSTDPGDSGHVGCWEWNFGDPSSGADNVSFLRGPTHDYAQPGSYTVTLTAIDDDGFATGTTTGHVTANP